MFDKKSIADAIQNICDEKGIAMEAVLETIEAALAAAYRKDFGEKNQNVKVDFDLETGAIKVFDVKTVVEDLPAEMQAELEQQESPESIAYPSASAEGEEEDEEVRRFNPKTEIQLSEAQKIKKNYKLEDEVKTELEVPGEFGRMAAQTAKQVIIQKLRETERENIFQEFKDKEGEIILGTIQRREGNVVLVDLGRTIGVMPPDEQIRTENYVAGAHVKVYVISVNTTTKGPEIVVSRSHPEIVKKLFTLEIPEISSGVVEIKSIAREAGSRSKIAVWTDQENIDPIGSCIGQRGARIQTIISELKGEKVDIIEYSEDPKEYISNALSPAKIISMEMEDAGKIAKVMVNEDQLSLAIGKAGQNVRLASRLTGWKIDIISSGGKTVSPDEAAEDSSIEASEEEVEESTKDSETEQE
jgi:N utilization substance protein A